ncbi:MAG: phospholipid-binding protein MlaC [Sphingomonadales bacterium]
MFQRTRFLASISALAALIVLSLPAKNASADEIPATSEGAREFVSELVDNALSALRNKALAVEERKDQLAGHLREGFALDYISRFVLGRHWRKATSEQRVEYMDLFSDFIIETYSIRLDEYTDETVEIGEARAAGKKDIIVASKIIRRNGPPVSVDWRIRVKDEVYKVIDLSVEGISMAISQREEFSAVVQKDGIDGLLTGLRDKLNDTRQAPTVAIEASSGG